MKWGSLKSKPEDEIFHRSRVIFCIKEDRIEVGPKGIKDSHLEWFKKEGWITEANAELFLNKTIRGFYLMSENSLYCYKGIGFYYDDVLIQEVLAKLPELKKILNLNEKTKIYFGPKDSPIEGKEYPRYCAGVLTEFFKR